MNMLLMIDMNMNMNMFLMIDMNKTSVAFLSLMIMINMSTPVVNSLVNIWPMSQNDINQHYMVKHEMVWHYLTWNDSTWHKVIQLDMAWHVTSDKTRHDNPLSARQSHTSMQHVFFKARSVTWSRSWHWWWQSQYTWPGLVPQSMFIIIVIVIIIFLLFFYSLFSLICLIFFFND